MPIREGEFATTIVHEERYRFRIDFGTEKLEPMFMDEPEPLGTGRYPNAGRLLAAAVGNCLCASFLFCMEKSRAEVSGLRADVETTLQRNEHGRLRITRIAVKMFAQTENGPKLDRCREIFEDFCIVSQSVKQGIDVDVELFPTGASDAPGTF
ncbi:MAG: OsmC family protein [Euryarchaeota archaeon]|nr:OsmC family protein [Euryarchaeota archaeon]